MKIIMHPPTEESTSELLSSPTVYKTFARVLEYSKEYQAIQKIYIADDGMEACAVVQLPKNYSRGNYYVHPIWIDALAHVSGFSANKQAPAHELMLCLGFGTMEFLPGKPIDLDAKYLVYAKNELMSNKTVVGEVYAMRVEEPRCIIAHVRGLQFHPLNLTGYKKRMALVRANIAIAHSQSSPLPQGPAFSNVPTCNQDSVLPTGSVALIAIKIICDACDLSADAVNRDTDLESMGIDSMMSMELVGVLRLTFPGVALDSNFFYGFTTVGELCEGLIKKLDEA
ncbi:hypothetical protein FB45DRAFT_943423 [Roridomyces roridus]|uniref:Carrier domain-containing protein n=1 Tax=Roridomyces roridus TaxID=1738132 RepID=A0AAD7B3S4_9AGAR|nr:hypothetical protein FB45DRAFT_943423 [Roridomyces roridus]